MTEEEIFDFARDRIKSVWALELVVLLHARAGQALSADELVRELRGSDAVILSCLAVLRDSSLIAGDSPGPYRYAPATPELDAMTGELARIYAVRPMALAKAIMRGPNDKLRIFSDAFRLKD